MNSKKKRKEIEVKRKFLWKSNKKFLKNKWINIELSLIGKQGFLYNKWNNGEKNFHKRLKIIIKKLIIFALLCFSIMMYMALMKVWCKIINLMDLEYFIKINIISSKQDGDMGNLTEKLIFLQKVENHLGNINLEN